MKKHKPKSARAQTERRILIMLALFSISVGLWSNFRQLWLEENGLSAADISNITSIATFMSVAGVILVGVKVRMQHLQTFMTAILGVSLLNLLILAGLHHSSARLLIDVCTIVDVVTNWLIVASVYPLITTVMKSNQAYSKRKLVEYLFKDVGVLIGGIFIGQTFAGIAVDYNACLLISAVFMLLAMCMMMTLKIKITSSSSQKPSDVVRYVLKSKIQTCYMIYSFLAATSFAAALGLKMLILTNYLDFSPSTATNYLLVAGLIADGIGIFALKHFTPKNDYVTMTLKFGIRLMAYIIAVLADDPFISLLAITWSLLSSTAYEDVSDGHYINVVDNRHQLGYNMLKHVTSCLGEAFGLLLCGWMYDFGVTAILGLSAIIMVGQMALAYYLIFLRQRRRRVRHSASRLRYDERMIEE